MSTIVLPPKVVNRLTPSLAEVQSELGGPVLPYNERFLLREGKQARAIERIKAIREAGEQLIDDPEVGLNWITSGLVAREAGVSIGTFYRYFEDTVALLDYIWPERQTSRK